MSANKIQTFTHSDIGEIKGFIGADGEPWFLAGQVCRALGIKNSRDAVASIKARYKTAGVEGVGSSYTLIETSGGKQKTLIIPEPYLYELIFQSRKQKAIKFRAWVTSDVLPSLRKHGEYRMKGKMIRLQETDSIKRLVEKAEADGSKNANMYYTVVTKMTNGLLGIKAGTRDQLSAGSLKRVAMLEDIVGMAIDDGLKGDLTYKEVYQLAKARAKASLTALGVSA